MERQRIIAITPEESKYLQKIFDCSNVTVWQAVKYVKNNDLHQRIRLAAIKRGNPQMVLVPEFDTIFLTNREDADNRMTRYMVQTFENGATLDANLATGKITVRNRQGEIKGEWYNVRLSELETIQEAAMSL